MDVYINPDEKHILSATDSDAILLGTLYEGDDDNCVLYVPRDVYFEAMRGWLDRKAMYNSPQGWAGVGNIVFKATKIESGECHLAKYLVSDDEPDPDEPTAYVSVPVYRAEKDYDIDMEHG